MTDTPARKDIHIAFAHSKTSEEKEAVENLARALRESGESVGARMRVDDSVDAQSIFEGLIWFLQHPNTVSVGVNAVGGIMSGATVLMLDRWLSKPDRRLEVEFEGTKSTANNVDELKQILASLPPPKPKRILQEGEMMLDGEIMPFDEDLWNQHQGRWIQSFSKGNADDQDK